MIFLPLFGWLAVILNSLKYPPLPTLTVGRRGVGERSGIWNDADATLAVSKNFVTYRLNEVGPIRTVLDLTYAYWSGNSSANANGLAYYELWIII